MLWMKEFNGTKMQFIRDDLTVEGLGKCAVSKAPLGPLSHQIVPDGVPGASRVQSGADVHLLVSAH